MSDHRRGWKGGFDCDYNKSGNTGDGFQKSPGCHQHHEPNDYQDTDFGDDNHQFEEQMDPRFAQCYPDHPRVVQWMQARDQPEQQPEHQPPQNGFQKSPGFHRHHEPNVYQDTDFGDNNHQLGEADGPNAKIIMSHQTGGCYNTRDFTNDDHEDDDRFGDIDDGSGFQKSSSGFHQDQQFIHGDGENTGFGDNNHFGGDEHRQSAYYRNKGKAGRPSKYDASLTEEELASAKKSDRLSRKKGYYQRDKQILSQGKTELERIVFANRSIDVIQQSLSQRQNYNDSLQQFNNTSHATDMRDRDLIQSILSTPVFQRKQQHHTPSRFGGSSAHSLSRSMQNPHSTNSRHLSPGLHCTTKGFQGVSHYSNQTQQKQHHGYSVRSPSALSHYSDRSPQQQRHLSSKFSDVSDRFGQTQQHDTSMAQFSVSRYSNQTQQKQQQHHALSGYSGVSHHSGRTQQQQQPNFNASTELSGASHSAEWPVSNHSTQLSSSFGVSNVLSHQNNASGMVDVFAAVPNKEFLTGDIGNDYATIMAMNTVYCDDTSKKAFAKNFGGQLTMIRIAFDQDFIFSTHGFEWVGDEEEGFYQNKHGRHFPGEFFLYEGATLIKLRYGCYGGGERDMLRLRQDEAESYLEEAQEEFDRSKFVEGIYSQPYSTVPAQNLERYRYNASTPSALLGRHQRRVQNTSSTAGAAATKLAATTVTEGGPFTKSGLMQNKVEGASIITDSLTVEVTGKSGRGRVDESAGVTLASVPAAESEPSSVQALPSFGVSTKDSFVSVSSAQDSSLNLNSGDSVKSLKAPSVNATAPTDLLKSTKNATDKITASSAKMANESKSTIMAASAKSKVVLPKETPSKSIKAIASPPASKKTPSKSMTKAAGSAATKNASSSSKKKKKAKKDPNTPKRNNSAYILFCKHIHSTVKEENPEASFGDIAKIKSKKYKALKMDERKEWDDKAALDKERYAREMKAYRNNGN